MPCNAWNHSSTCECGWGGQWHGSYGGRLPNQAWLDEQLRYRDYFYQYWSHGRLGQIASYVNPNATCPVCGDWVYFYQSPHGGRVFFDELGPPWPKHPCTDNSSPKFGSPRCRDYPKPYTPQFSSIPAEPQWAKIGWDAVLLAESFEQSSFTVIVLERVEGDGRIVLGIQKALKIDINSPIFVQERVDALGVVDLSFLSLRDGRTDPTLETGYRNARRPEDAEDWQQAIAGSPAHQNRVALRLILDNESPRPADMHILDKRIDIDAATFWFQRAAQAGYGAAMANRRVVDAKRLGARLSGRGDITEDDFHL